MRSTKKQLFIYTLVVIFIFVSSPVIPDAGETSINLRSSYAELSASQVQQLPHKSIRKAKKWGFYGHSTISHMYEKSVIDGDKVVVDNATGLIWHQSGSEKHMGWKKAKKWLEDLNEKGYAGCNDWRLPTVEEALSLLESKKNRYGTYIDAVFDKEQDWIWTGDSYIPGGAWEIVRRSVTVTFNSSPASQIRRCVICADNGFTGIGIVLMVIGKSEFIR